MFDKIKNSLKDEISLIKKIKNFFDEVQFEESQDELEDNMAKNIQRATKLIDKMFENISNSLRVKIENVKISFVSYSIKFEVVEDINDDQISHSFGLNILDNSIRLEEF